MHGPETGIIYTTTRRDRLTLQAVRFVDKKAPEIHLFFARARCLSAGLRYLRLTRLPRHDRGPVPGGNRSAASCPCTVLRRASYHYATRSPQKCTCDVQIPLWERSPLCSQNSQRATTGTGDHVTFQNCHRGEGSREEQNTHTEANQTIKGRQGHARPTMRQPKPKETATRRRHNFGWHSSLQASFHWKMQNVKLSVCPTVEQ